MAIPFEVSESTQSNRGVLRRRGSVTLESIENLLAQAANVREVTPSMISLLCEERRIDLPNRLARGRKQLYRRYLKHCFEDKRLSEEERTDLAHLRSLLHLSSADLSAIHDDVAIEVYGEAVQDVLEDFVLDDDEAEFLRELRTQLELTDAKAERIYRDGSNLARNRAMSQAESRDRQFTERRAAAGEFTGRSDSTLEKAIDDALAMAGKAISRLRWFEVTEISGYVSDGRTESWHVTVKAGIGKDED